MPEEFRQIDQLNARADGVRNILGTINEHPEIDGASVKIDEASEDTVIQRQPSNLMFAPEPQVTNQLELQSQSEHNTVMGQSPVKP